MGKAGKREVAGDEVELFALRRPELVCFSSIQAAALDADLFCRNARKQRAPQAVPVLERNAPRAKWHAGRRTFRS